MFDVEFNVARCRAVVFPDDHNKTNLPLCELSTRCAQNDRHLFVSSPQHERSTKLIVAGF